MQTKRCGTTQKKKPQRTLVWSRMRLLVSYLGFYVAVCIGRTWVVKSGTNSRPLGQSTRPWAGSFATAKIMELSCCVMKGKE